MKGFDPRTDLPDYILGITGEDRGMARLHHRCGRDMPGHGSQGIVVGAQAAIEGTDRSIAPVLLRGASHAERGPPGLRRDFVLLHGVHVQKQILLHQG